MIYVQIVDTQNGNRVFVSILLDFRVTSIRKEKNLVVKTQNSKKWKYGIICRTTN